MTQSKSRWGVVALVVAAIGGSAFAVPRVAAQLQTSDPMTTHSFSVDGELQAGAAQYRRASGGCFTLPDGTLLCDAPSVTILQPFAALALDVQDRVLRVGREDENLFVEMDGNLRFGVREAYRDDGSWNGAWLSAWIAVAIAHRTPSLTLRASFGVAPPLRTALHRTLPHAQLAAGWGQWDHWLSDRSAKPG